MTAHPLRLGLAAVLLVLASTCASAAPDAKAVADSLVAAVTAAGSTATYETAAASGEDVVVTDFKMTQRGYVLTVPSFVIAAPVVRPEGGFTATRLGFDNASAAGGESGRSVTWATGSAEDAILLTPEEVKTRAMVRPFRTFRLGDVTMGLGGSSAPLKIAAVDAEFAEVKAGEHRGFTMRAGPISTSIDVLAEMPTYRHILDILKYQNLTLNVAAEGGYDDKTDTLTLSSLTIDTAEVGKVTLSGKFSGMSLGRIAEKEDSIATTAQAKLDGMHVRFANGGVIDRVVEMQANATGSTREEVVEQAKAFFSLPFLLSGNLEFSGKIEAVLGTFLADPKTLTVTIAPPAPVTLGKIFSAAIGAQETLPELLGVDVEANGQ